MSLVTLPPPPFRAATTRHQQEPGRDQEHRAVEAVGREIDDQRKAREGDHHQRHPRDAGGDRGIEQSSATSDPKKASQPTVMWE